jgi:competence protein ComEC
LVAGSTAACVGLVPLMAEYFHLFTPVSVLANVVVVPVLGVIMSVGLLAILTYPVGPVLAEIFNNANYALLLAMMEVVQWISEWPAGHWCVRAPPVWLSAAYYAGLLAAARWPAAWLGLPLLTAALFLPWPPERAVEVTIMDVSRGGAIFVDAPGERADFLVDGSDAAGGARVVVPCLRTAGVDRLAAMVLTRADQNHAAGLSAVAAAVSVERAFHAGLWSRSAAYAEWLADCRRRGIPLEKWRRGVEWGLVRVFHPPPAGAAARSEDQALVLGLEFGPTRVLLVGDASAAVLSAIAPLVQAYRPQVVVQGAGGASWPEFREFLMSVRPEQAVICRPPPTRFHPRRELPDPPVPVWRTDDSGAVKVRLTRSGYRIQTMLPARGTESVRSGSDPRQFALGGRADAHAAGEHPREMKPVGKRQPLGDRLETFVRERESVSGRGNAALEALAIDAGEPDPGRQEMNPPRHQGIVSASPLHTGSVAGGPGRDVAPNAGH